MTVAGGGRDNKYTYDLGQIDGGPRLPTADDFGGDAMKDQDGEAPPYLDQMTGGGDNERNRALEGLCRVAPRATVWVEFPSPGNPVIAKVKAMGRLITEASFTPTTSGAGQTRIAWAAFTLPPQEAAPKTGLNDGPGGHFGRLVVGNPLAVDVFTYDMAGVGTEMPFWVDLH